jgi:hypothetical protein
MSDFSCKVALIYLEESQTIFGSHPYHKLDECEIQNNIVGEVRIDLKTNELHVQDLISLLKKNPTKRMAIANWADTYTPPSFTYWESIL